MFSELIVSADVVLRSNFDWTEIKRLLVGKWKGMKLDVRRAEVGQTHQSLLTGDNQNEPTE
jgi:hypothetical protein